MVNLLSKAWAIVKGKARLYVEYVLIACSVVGLSWAVATHYQNKRLEMKVDGLQQAQGGLITTVQDLQAVNKGQQKAIEEVQHLREVDHGVLQALMDGVTDIYSRDAKLRKQLNKLRRNNEAAKKFLDTPAPASVQCVLNRTPCTDPGDQNTGADATGAPGAAQSVSGPKHGAD